MLECLIESFVQEPATILRLPTSQQQKLYRSGSLLDFICWQISIGSWCNLLVQQRCCSNINLYYTKNIYHHLLAYVNMVGDWTKGKQHWEDTHTHTHTQLVQKTAINCIGTLYMYNYLKFIQSRENNFHEQRETLIRSVHTLFVANSTSAKELEG